MTLCVGYGQTEITPDLNRPVFLAGFGQNRRAETIHDELTARALALQDENRMLILVALDLIGFFRRDVFDVVQKVKEACKASKIFIIIASTHTHHGPDTMGLWGPDDKTCGVDLEYLTGLKEKIVDTILASIEKMQPATLKVSSVQVPGVVKNARDPNIIDHELTVAQFCTPQVGNPLLTLFNFPCHPEVLWEHNPHISADYPGFLRKRVEIVTGAPCIFFSGALGGMMTPDVKDHSFEEAEQMGEVLAKVGINATQTAVIDQLPSVSFNRVDLRLKLTNILFKLAIKRGLLPDIRNKKGEIDTEVSLIKIGPLWLTAIPGEMLPKLGLTLKTRLKEAGAQVPGVIGLANDELSYILPREDFRYPLNPFSPGKHYEETMSISKEIGPKVMDAVLSLL